MNELLLYVIMAFMGLAIAYLIIKVRQPVEIRGTREKREKEGFLDDLGEIGMILKEIQPEIEKGLKLNEAQKKSLTNWVNTIAKVTESRLLKWLAKRFMK